MTRREKLMHPATFISLAALFVALGGVGYAATKIGTKQLRNRAVTAPKLANNSVTTPKIRAAAVGNRRLANNSVSTSKIQNRAIISADLALGSVLNGNLGNGAVTSEKIGTGAVISSKLAANSVTNPAIAPDSITAAQIANGQVVEGNGTLSSVEVQLPNGALNSPILSLAGLGVLRADCDGGDSTVQFLNSSGTTVDLRWWGVADGEPPIIDSEPVDNDSFVFQESGMEGIMGLTWMASFGQGANLHLATINTSTRNASGTCAISVQATYTS
jgi:hypothetical protein